jgi:hypothetical protein
VFQELLKPVANSTPAEDIDRVSDQLPDRVEQSHLHWWQTDSASTPGKTLLILVAPWSHYDLVLLDLIEEELIEGAKIREVAEVAIFVDNIDRYETLEQIKEMIPLIKSVPQTPVSAVWEDGKLKKTSSGYFARVLVAEAMNLSLNLLDERILARVPRYTGRPIS